MNPVILWQSVWKWILREIAEIVGFMVSSYHWVLNVTGMDMIALEGSLDGRVLLVLDDGREVPPEILLREAVVIRFAFPVVHKGGGEREAALELCVRDSHSRQSLVVEKQIRSLHPGANDIRGDISLASFWATPGADRCQIELRLRGRAIWRSPVGARFFKDCRTEKLEAVLANIGGGEVFLLGGAKNILAGPHLHASLGNVYPALRLQAALHWLWVPILKIRVDVRLIDGATRLVRNQIFELRFTRDSGDFALGSFALDLAAMPCGDYRLEAHFRGRVIASRPFTILDHATWRNQLSKLVANDLQESGQLAIALKKAEQLRRATRMVEDFDYLAFALSGMIRSLPSRDMTIRSTVDLLIAKGRSPYEKLDTRPLVASNGPLDLPFAVLSRDDHRYLRRPGKVRIKVMLEGSEIASATFEIISPGDFARALRTRITAEVICPDGSTRSLQHPLEPGKDEDLRVYFSLREPLPQIPPFLECPKLQFLAGGKVIAQVNLPWEHLQGGGRIGANLSNKSLQRLTSAMNRLAVTCSLKDVTLATMWVGLKRSEIIDREGNLLDPDRVDESVTDEELAELIRAASR